MEQPEVQVLIADDSPEARHLLSIMLKGQPYEVREAEDGPATLRALETAPPSVVLLDFNMPGMNGDEVLRRMPKEMHQVIMLTAMDDSGTIIRCYAEGAVNYILKPVTDRKLFLAAVERAARSILHREEERLRTQRLKAQADWQYWKGLFLSGDNQNDSIKALDQMHVQFNQDVNYPHMLSMLKECGGAEGNQVALPRSLFRHVVESLEPLARFSEGVSLATQLIHREPDRRDISPREFADAVRERAGFYQREIAPIRRQKLTASIHDFKHEGEKHLNLDLGLMLEALDEIVTNACKYSDDESEVLFVFDPHEDEIAITVSNPATAVVVLPNGETDKGVPREMEEVAFRFFLRFSKFQDQRFHERWPMGLGLPLVKRSFEAHGGRVSLHNENWYVGAGATTRVTFLGTLPLRGGPPKAKEEAAPTDDFELF